MMSDLSRLDPHRRLPRPGLPWRILLMVAIASAGVAWALSRSEAELPEAVPLPVVTTVAEPVSGYTAERTYAGEITASRSSQLGFEAGGTVIELLADDGDAVSAGEPLARLDIRSLRARQRELQAQRAQAEAQLQELQTGPRTEDIAAAEAAVADLEQQVALARIQRQRREELYARGAISLEELDQQSFGTGSLESRLQQAQSQLQELRNGTRPEQIAAQRARVQQLEASLQSVAVDLAKSEITAPFSGRISQRLVDEGTVVASGQGVFELVETEALEARIGLPAAVADRLRVGQSQALRVGSRTYEARIAALLPELDAASRTVTAVLALSAEAAPFVGETAQLRVPTPQQTEGFWVPSTALMPGAEGLWSLYVADSQEQGYTAARRDVEVLHTQGDHSLVRGTVQAGEAVIATGVHRVAVGQAVAPQ